MFKQGQQQALPKLQRQRELAAQLPHTVQEEEKGGCLVLGAGVGEGGVGTAQLEGMASLGKGRAMGTRKWGFLERGVGLGLGGHLPGSTLAPQVPGTQPWSGSRGPG